MATRLAAVVTLRCGDPALQVWSTAVQGQVKAGLGWHPNQLLANKALRRSRMSTTTLRTFMSWSLLAEFFVAWRGRRVTIGKRAPCIQATARHARGCGGIRYHVFFAPMTSIAWVRSRASHARFQELVKLSFQLFFAAYPECEPKPKWHYTFHMRPLGNKSAH